jgi:hypothetical protein
VREWEEGRVEFRISSNDNNNIHLAVTHTAWHSLSSKFDSVPPGREKDGVTVTVQVRMFLINSLLSPLTKSLL